MHNLRLFVVAVGALISWMAHENASAQTISTRTIGPFSGDWFTASAWSNGVPNEPGAVAQLQLTPGVSGVLQLSNSATVGQLQVAGSGSLTLSGAGPLNLAGDVGDELLVDLTPQGGSLSVSIAAPLALSSAASTRFNVPASSSLQFNTSFAAGSGGFVKDGAGVLTLNGSNANWNGELTLNEGLVTLNHPAALGTAAGGTTIGANGTLQIKHVSSEPLTFDGGVVQVTNVEFSNPIFLVSTGTIYRPPNAIVGGQQSSTGATVISGAISGAGNLRLDNKSIDPFRLTGNNSYSGRTYIVAGPVFATTANSLGTSDEGTTVQGGVLTIEAASNEQFRVEGGELRFQSTSALPTTPITSAGGTIYFPNLGVTPTPVTADGVGGTISSNGSWTGGSSGSGDLRLRGGLKVDAALAHAGKLTLEEAYLNVANSYAGETIVVGSAVANHTGALGQSPTVRIQGGSLTLNAAPAGSPTYYVERGTLNFAAAGQSVSSAIYLGGGSGDVWLDGSAVYNGPIVAQAGSGDKRIGGGVLNGPLSGPGNVILGGTAAKPSVLNAANNLAGMLNVRGVTVVNHAQAIDGFKTVVTDNRLELNVPTTGNIISNHGVGTSTAGGTIAFNAPQDYSDTWVVNAGTLEANAPLSFDKLIALGSFTSGSLAIFNGQSSIRVDEELRVQHQARIEGRLRGSGTIRNVGSRLFLTGNLAAFTGELDLRRGVTIVSPETANNWGAGDIHVREEGTLLLGESTSEDYLIANDVYLHNAHGNRNQPGALVNSYHAVLVRLAGRVDVGDQGSTISGNISIEGQLVGNNLTQRSGGLSIKSPQSELQGTLRIVEGSLRLSGNGRLQNLEAILLEDDGTLSMDDTTLPTPHDRIAESIVIRSRGGNVHLYSNNQPVGAETLGTLRLERGSTRVLASGDPGAAVAKLVVTDLQREPGAVLFAQGDGAIGFVNNPALEHGMIGPWAIMEGGFATLNGFGNITTLAPTAATLVGASSSDHVSMTGSQTIGGVDRTIASLRSIGASQIDLGGRRLTIASGGIFRVPHISNGELTAGQGEDAELVMHISGGEVSANIVDNGEGSVSLVVAGGEYHRLSGANAYTGGTWVTNSPISDGRLRISNFAAIPVNDRVHVDSATYDIEALPAGTVKLSELHLRGEGVVTSGLAAIDADFIYLEEGDLRAVLTGDGEITKHTDGDAEISRASPAFTGAVTIRDGSLRLPSNLILPNAAIAVEGGELNLAGTGSYANNIVLRGGALAAGNLNGTLEVQSASQITANGTTTVRGALKGAGDLEIRGRQDQWVSDFVALYGDASQYSGNIRVESGALRIGNLAGNGTGDVTVALGGRLLVGGTSGATNLQQDVHLEGGTLYGFGASPRTVSGDVFVASEAFIGASSSQLKLASVVTLADGAEVYGLSDSRHQVADAELALVDVAGELKVGANATWRLLTSSLSISGTVTANSPTASINFVGIPESLRFDGATIDVAAGENLSLLINGGALPVEFSGADNVLQGHGSLEGDFTLSNGASVSPGSSPGLLTVRGDLKLGAGALLSIEAGGAGLGLGYDSLRVVGDVTLDGAILDMTLLDGFIPAPADGFIILRSSSITGTFQNAPHTITVGGVTLPVTYLPNMVIVGNPAAIPEPAAWVLLLIACCAAPRLRRMLG